MTQLRLQHAQMQKRTQFTIQVMNTIGLVVHYLLSCDNAKLWTCIGHSQISVFCLKFTLCFYNSICFQVYSLHSFLSTAENRTNLLPRDVRYSVFFLCGSWCRCNRVTHGAVDRNSTYKDESISDLEMEALQVGVIVCQTCGINC